MQSFTYETLGCIALQVYDVIFTVLDEDFTTGSTKLTQSQVAKMMPPPLSWKSDATAVAWQLKHSLNGIQPARAVVVMTQSVTIQDSMVFAIQWFWYLTFKLFHFNNFK